MDIINSIHNEDCRLTMQHMIDEGIRADIILTSPPYGTSRGYYNDNGLNWNQRKYDTYADRLSSDEYIDWIVGVLNLCEQCLKPNGVLLLNLSYSNDCKSKGSDLDRLIITLSKIISETAFTIADRIIWKKDRAIPNSTSPNKLTRIAEDVYVLCRKTEKDTYICNKTAKSTSSRGQQYYTSIQNYVEARNNDGYCKLNKATYSVELCRKLLMIYAKQGMLVYDPFIGTGTTAVACIELGLDYIGSEISEAQCEYASQRLTGNTINLSLDLAILNNL